MLSSIDLHIAPAAVLMAALMVVLLAAHQAVRSVVPWVAPLAVDKNVYPFLK
jgi:hypothetical protein